MKKPTSAEVLSLKMEQNDAEAGTVQEYLLTLLETLWSEKEGFSGKRPLGNSGWEYELYAPLIRAGFAEGSLDSDGYVETLDKKEADLIISNAIRSLKETL